MIIKNYYFKFIFYILLFLAPVLIYDVIFHFIIGKNINLIPSENILATYSLGLNYKFIEFKDLTNLNIYKKNEILYFLHLPNFIFNFISSIFINEENIYLNNEIYKYYIKIKIFEYLVIILASVWASSLALKCEKLNINGINIFFFSIIIFLCPIVISTRTINFPYFFSLLFLTLSFVTIFLYLNEYIKSERLFNLAIFKIGFISGSFYFGAFISAIFFFLLVLFFYSKLKNLKIELTKFKSRFNIISIFIWPLILINIPNFIIGYIPNDNLMIIIFFIFVLIIFLFINFFIKNFNFRKFFFITNLCGFGFFLSANITILYWGGVLKYIFSNQQILGTKVDVLTNYYDILYFLFPIFSFLTIIFFIIKLLKQKNKFNLFFLIIVTALNLILFRNHLFGFTYFANYGINFRYFLPTIISISFSIFLLNYNCKKNLLFVLLTIIIYLYYPIDFFNKINIQKETNKKVRDKIFKILNNKNYNVFCRSMVIKECYDANKLNFYISKKNQKKIKYTDNSKTNFINEAMIGFSDDFDMIIDIDKNIISANSANKYGNFKLIYVLYDKNFREYHQIFVKN